jgi:uncharacterized protein (DUF2336 family)
MATVSSFEGMTQPGRHELKQFAELFAPIYKASSPDARRNAVAALSRCAVMPASVARFIGSQPIDIAAIFLTRSPAIDDETLIAIARSHGAAHSRAIAARENLSVKVIDQLVSLHDGQGGVRRQPVSEPVQAETVRPMGEAERQEELRLQLKALVYRDTLMRAEEHPDNQEAMTEALLVRFARLREARDFSRLLASMIGCSQWLTNRILLDLSGLQLATTLVALGITTEDGVVILKQFYPHLAMLQDDIGRAELLWQGLDPETSADRLAAWVRADDYTQGKAPAEETAANANEAVPAIHAVPGAPARRAVFGHGRGVARR